MAFEYRRHPAVPKKISDITESDARVRILGKVIDRADGVLVVDDGTGRAEIISDIDAAANGIVRIFARVLQLESGYELRAELIQSMDALDMELYGKVMVGGR